MALALMFQHLFIKDFNMYNKHIKSFRVIINEILEGETQTSFVKKTELTEIF